MSTMHQTKLHSGLALTWISHLFSASSIPLPSLCSELINLCLRSLCSPLPTYPDTHTRHHSGRQATEWRVPRARTNLYVRVFFLIGLLCVSVYMLKRNHTVSLNFYFSVRTRNEKLQLLACCFPNKHTKRTGLLSYSCLSFGRGRLHPSVRLWKVDLHSRGI